MRQECWSGSYRWSRISGSSTAPVPHSIRRRRRHRRHVRARRRRTERRGVARCHDAQVLGRGQPPRRRRSRSADPVATRPGGRHRARVALARRTTSRVADLPHDRRSSPRLQLGLYASLRRDLRRRKPWAAPAPHLSAIPHARRRPGLPAGPACRHRAARLVQAIFAAATVTYPRIGEGGRDRGPGGSTCARPRSSTPWKSSSGDRTAGCPSFRSLWLCRLSSSWVSGRVGRRCSLTDPGRRCSSRRLGSPDRRRADTDRIRGRVAGVADARRSGR